jgi:hypothetical protein
MVVAVHLSVTPDMLQVCVSSVSCECCKSRSGCCICCNGYTRMLQVSVLNVSSVFFRRMLQMCLFECCICFTHMLRVFYLDVTHAFAMTFQMFSDVSTSVSDPCFKCFICLQTYDANVLSGCFKNRLDVVAGDPLAAAGVRVGEVEEGARAVFGGVRRHGRCLDGCGSSRERTKWSTCVDVWTRMYVRMSGR